MAYPLNMKINIGYFFFFFLVVSSYVASTNSEDGLAPGPEPDIPVPGHFVNNPRLRRAYTALQAIKRTIHSDPLKAIENWVGPDVCSYTGVSCAAALDDPSVQVVAGLDLNQGDIAGYLPPEIELLTELGFLHINSNRFCGIIPQGIKNLPLLFELDISNNRFVGPFPKAVLDMPNLKYLDIRFNNFEGKLPPELFEKELDAIFVNDNRFIGSIPETVGKSTASVMVFANNKLSGCIPASIGNMPNLEQVIFSYNNLTGCLPEEIGRLSHVEVLDISDNKFTGDVPDSICNLPKLANLSIANNYFVKAGAFCYSPMSGIGINDTANCLVGLPQQKPESICSPLVGIDGAIDCSQCRAPDDGSNHVGQTGSESPESAPTMDREPTSTLAPETTVSEPPASGYLAPTPVPHHQGVYAPVSAPTKSPGKPSDNDAPVPVPTKSSAPTPLEYAPAYQTMPTRANPPMTDDLPYNSKGL